jgi:hypothetical protein
MLLGGSPPLVHLIVPNQDRTQPMCRLAGKLNLTVITPPDNAALLAAPGGVEASAISGHPGTDADDLAVAQLAGVGLQRVRQQAATRRGRLLIDPSGRVRWAG